MKRKVAEKELKDLANNLGLFSYKFRDRGYVNCPHCHRSIVSCPYCRQDMLLPKAASYPDFLLSYQPIFIEVKWGKDRYQFEDISPAQRQALSDNKHSWVFVIIGDGRAPAGRGAWLIPWTRYIITEIQCEQKEVKSLLFQKTERSRVPEADEFWKAWRLKWANGGWSIPLDHEWTHLYG